MNKLRNLYRAALIASLLFVAMWSYCLAFDTNDEPPPPPVGHTVYCLTRSEVVDAIKLWMKQKNLPITGEVTLDTCSGYYLNTVTTTTASSAFYSDNKCTPSPKPKPWSESPWLKVRVEYKAKAK